jgi:hypothetical protein
MSFGYNFEQMIYNNAHYYKVNNAVKKAKSPVVIVWLGTCDIAEKKGKYISTTNLFVSSRCSYGIPLVVFVCSSFTVTISYFKFVEPGNRVIWAL